MDIVCDGSEDNLDRCLFHWAEGACNHSMDAVVECYGGTPTGDASTPEQCSIDTLQELLALARQELNNERDARVRERGARVRQMIELKSERDARLRDMTELQRNVTSLQSVTNTMERKLSSKYKTKLQGSMHLGTISLDDYYFLLISRLI